MISKQKVPSSIPSIKAEINEVGGRRRREGEEKMVEEERRQIDRDRQRPIPIFLSLSGHYVSFTIVE